MSDREYHFFQQYYADSITLPIYQDTERWNRLFLQLEPCIRHAVTATGGLSLKDGSGKRNGVDRLRRELAFNLYGTIVPGAWICKFKRSADDSLPIERHQRKFAYHQCAIAIQSLRKAMADDKSNIRTRFSTGVLFASFA